MVSIPTPRLRATAAGLLKAAEFTVGREAPELLLNALFELLQLSSFKYWQIVGLERPAQLERIMKLNKIVSFTLIFYHITYLKTLPAILSSKQIFSLPNKTRSKNIAIT